MTNMKCPSLSLSIDFRLKPILLDIRIATLACFLGTFDWNFFPTLYLSQYQFLRLKCISCMHQNDGFCFYIQSVSLYLFIGELSQFILRDTGY